MNLETCTWTKADYQKFLSMLYELQEIKYREFSQKLFDQEPNMIGIRVPILKDLAKKIAKGNSAAFLKYPKKLYEERLIHGLVIGDSKRPLETILDEIESFFPYNDNWAINDIVCANMKQFKKVQALGIIKIKEWLQSDEVFVVRFALVLLLDHYINDTYIDEIITLTKELNREEYYIQMAQAWLYSICYIKYPDKILPLLEKKQLNLQLHNKTIQKIRESTRISKEEKQFLATLKR